eukprot:CAMPEP_0176301134 /NCGR_PEP_ID=MMETSP0121_2-20121125/60697_1 /TAXON_ID=160619 /ORGANISM="Kryptoperidinium foliaceum, Strain CCMP 1326" /LENGTH=84 /DNA_ID=CAMNT_0017642577 /DNA_START=70 /DNA_END=321 /DNA_ORIENTATION=+
MFSLCKTSTAETAQEVVTPAPTGTMPTGAADMPRQTSDYTHGVRTAQDERISPERALAKLQEGNVRFVSGAGTRANFDAEHRQA